MLVYGECECFVMQMLCLVCILWQFSMLRLHDLQFVNAGRGCNRRFSKRLFCLSRQKLCVVMVVCISWLHSYLCVWM